MELKMSPKSRNYDFGSRLSLLFQIDELPDIDWYSEPEDGGPARHGYLAHVVGTDEPAAVSFSAEELSRGMRLSASLQPGCSVGDRIRMPIEVREATVEDRSEFQVVVVGVPTPSPNSLTIEELARGNPITA